MDHIGQLAPFECFNTVKLVYPRAVVGNQRSCTTSYSPLPFYEPCYRILPLLQTYTQSFHTCEKGLWLVLWWCLVAILLAAS